MLMPAPQWLIERGRSKELARSNVRQPGRDNCQGQRDIMMAEKLAKGFKCASPGADVVSSKEQVWGMIPRVTFESGRKLRAPLPGREFPHG